ncbi:MAG: PspC domain-containing protein [Dehalococcoidia bacterium]
MARTRLYRSSSNKVLFGVAGGLGAYFNIDVVLVRVIFVVLCLTTGFPLILYPILAVIMPKGPAPGSGPGGRDEFGGIQRGTPAAGESSATPHAGDNSIRESESGEGRGGIGAFVLIGLGASALCAQVLGSLWIDWGVLWPLCLVVLGVGMLMGRLRRV